MAKIKIQGKSDDNNPASVSIYIIIYIPPVTYVAFLSLLVWLGIQNHDGFKFWVANHQEPMVLVAYRQ